MSFHHLFYPLIFLRSIPIVLGKGPNVSCLVSWFPSSLGVKLPENALECAAGTGEFVGKVFHNGGWYGGRVIPDKGAIYANVGSNLVITSPSYQVLLVPPHCSLTWIPGSLGSIPSHPVEVNAGPTNFLVARALDPSGWQTMCGYLNPAHASVLFSSSRDPLLPQDSPTYEILTSQYHPLDAELKKLVFTTSTLRNSDTTRETIGHEGLFVAGGTAALGAPGLPSYNIEHKKGLLERFSLTEDVHSWAGITGLSVQFDPFFGSSEVNFATRVLDGHDKVTYTRIRNVSAVATFIPAARTGTNLAEVSMEACSYANILGAGGVGVLYSGEIYYKSGEGLLRAEDIVEVLGVLGRPWVEVVDPYTVKGEVIRGVLTGRFVTSTAIHVGPRDLNFVCSRFR
ncbi:hypothetical protein Fcan01_26694 [Folsomia candida]|uniref:Uncharacterized protein n=2 Tax=Folsomia candida TaxID=158441 RepID=A0A226CZZ0_FOLCA|nr:hypothetical protein Fcan01_26694 [Folsomia candida]